MTVKLISTKCLFGKYSFKIKTTGTKSKQSQEAKTIENV